MVEKEILKEIACGRVVPFVNFRFSLLGVFPKKESTTFRMIHHLSFSACDSVKDCIIKELASVSYSTFDDAVALVRQFGLGALMAKAIPQSAFRFLPIHRSSFSS